MFYKLILQLFFITLPKIERCFNVLQNVKTKLLTIYYYCLKFNSL